MTQRKYLSTINDIGTVLYEVAGTTDDLVIAAEDFHAAMRLAATSSDYKFPVLVIHWTTDQDVDVAGALGFSQLADISESVSAVQILTIYRPTDTDLTSALKALSKHFSSEPSPAAIARERATRKRKIHNRIAKVKETSRAFQTYGPLQTNGYLNSSSADLETFSTPKFVSHLYDTIASAQDLLDSGRRMQ